jgi:DNA polymerase-3 subunit gamma/tau
VPVEPADPTPPPTPAGGLDAAALRRLWPEVLDVVKQTSRRTRALLDNAQITDVAGEQITLSAPTALAKMIAEDSNTSALREALTKVVGGQWKVAVSGAAAPTSSAAEPDPDPREDEDDTASGKPAEPVDPEAEALKLLREQLDARPLDG